MSKTLPKGSQVLVYPMQECTISAGFQNKGYKKAYGFAHLGIDCDSLGARDFDVVAAGTGVVLGVEFNNNSLGGVVVVRYSKVYMPAHNKVQDIIGRYYHMKAVSVKKGDSVSQYSVLGSVGGNHKWWNHIHLELDTDVQYPFHTAQVAEASSRLLIATGSTISTLLNPIDILVVGNGQTAIVHPLAKYAAECDNPKYRESDFDDSNNNDTLGPVTPPPNLLGGQKLILPINKCKITASMGSLAYLNKYNMNHYGVDLVATNGVRTVYASGDGSVLSVGRDNVFGNVVIVKYPSVFNHRTGATQDVIFRYYHAASIKVKAGAKVNKDTVLLEYGATGKYVDGKHLHITADYDTQYFNYEAGLKASSNIIKQGNDKTIFNPFDVLHCKTSSPDNQQLSRNTTTFNGNSFALSRDLDIPAVT